MGWIFLLIKSCIRSFVLAVDGLFERSLLKVVPDLENVLFDPHESLRGRDIAIGPARKYGTLFAWLVLVGLVGGAALALMTGLVLNGGKPGPGGFPFLFQVLAIPWLVFLVTVMLLIGRRVRGGEMVLAERGVELRYRGTAVFCAWEVFHTEGQPFGPDTDQVILPVAAGAVPLVQARRHDSLVAEGLQVNTRQFRFRSAREAVLQSLYEVNALELAKVLLHLGRVLGKPVQGTPLSLDFPPAHIEEPEPPSRGQRGWVTVSLTRLVFPPVCCECGAATGGRQNFRAAGSWFSFERLGHPTGKAAINIWVPVCYSCQTANKQKANQGTFLGLGTALAAIVLVGCLLRFFPANMGLVLLFILTVLLAPPLGTMLGYQWANRQVQPVEVGSYSPSRGTIAIRFRRSEYAEAFLKLIK